MPEDRDELKQKVRAILERHQGPDDCVNMFELFHAVTGLPVIPGRKINQTRPIRSLVEQLRREGCPIALRSGPNGGYFWARNDEELQSTITWFHDRAMSSLRQEAVLKRMEPAEVVKQYEIELTEDVAQ